MEQVINVPATELQQSNNGKGGLKIIGAGFGRTGTLSLKAALEQLGFAPCYHMTELFQHPDQIAYWEAATNGEPVDWHELFNHYQATVDWPACAFYAQLMEAYPEAKVLLSVRDPDRWYESVISTIYQTSGMLKSPQGRFRFSLFRILSPQRARIVRMINTLIWQNTFDNRFEDKAHALAVFQQHIEEVKQRVPADKLLVYNVKDGWEPLCAFLGVEVPANIPFPHLNDRNNFVGRTRRRQENLRMVGITLGALFSFTTLLLLLTRLSKRNRK